jgi:hypothetical protein
MYEAKLIRSINSGRCFALLGSGPSNEMGYKSWGDLSTVVYQTIIKQGHKIDEDSYDRYLKDKKYPELFRQAERDIGRKDLIALVKRILPPDKKGSDLLYSILTKWPFPCYLTTNYDNEIGEHLESLGVHYDTLRNRQQDFYPIRDGATNHILKLHSDLDHPEEVVLTSQDYDTFSTDPKYDYFRKRLLIIFNTFDVLILGHSLYDPDLQLILKFAKHIGDRDRPIYLIGANFTPAMEREFDEQYNIKVIGYDNTDGTHSKLRNLIKQADKWIISRNTGKPKEEFLRPPEDEIQNASAIYLFRKLQLLGQAEYLCPLALSALRDAEKNGLKFEDLFSKCHLTNLSISQEEYKKVILDGLASLIKDDLITQKGDCYYISPEGIEKVDEVRSIRESETNQAFGQFIVEVKRIFPAIQFEQEQQLKKLAENAVVNSFSQRGLVLANKVFAKQTANPDELSDIFEIVSKIAKEIPVAELASAFIESMHRFLINPNDPQKNYLASLSQGYFLYHFLGLDPRLTQIHYEVLAQTMWLCDSSILLPLAAAHCHNHEYAKELFELLKKSKTLVFTTSNLLEESWKHLEWAMNFVRISGIDSPEFLRLALVKGSYKQNLFIDGYINLASDGRVSTFKEYLDLIFGAAITKPSFENIFNRYGIKTLHLTDIEGFVEQDWGELEEVKHKVQELREQNGTFHSELQVSSEAEVWLIIHKLRINKYKLPVVPKDLENIYFISQSRLLDRITPDTKVITWTPEAVYRYLSSFPNSQMNPDLLQQCMVNEYFYAGISFIDESKYRRFFGPSIEQAKISFDNEKAALINKSEQISINFDDLSSKFDAIPDLEKPFFMAQLGWRVASLREVTSESYKQRALAAEEQLKNVPNVITPKKVIKVIERQEASRIKHQKDPKYLSKKLKQAKKRLRKKK